MFRQLPRQTERIAAVQFDIKQRSINLDFIDQEESLFLREGWPSDFIT